MIVPTPDCLRVNGKRVLVDYCPPPIPLRQWDYSAVFEGYEPGDYVGRGETAVAAIRDLKEHDEVTQ